eukprot:7426440-Karenia_brevis.AAC.1
MFADVELSIDSDDREEDVPVTPPRGPGSTAEALDTDSDVPGEPASGSELEPQYWVNITKRGRHRCLHRFGGCWRKPGACRQDYELFMEVTDTDYHSYCKACWPPARSSAAAHQEDDSGTDSSSTEDSGSGGYAEEAR